MMEKQSLYFEPVARITVGNIVFENVNNVVITENIMTLGNKAEAVLPRNYKDLDGVIGLLDLLIVGDKAVIELGVNEEYETEFTGYLKEIDAGTPLILRFDDELYPLKNSSFNKNFPSASLKELLTFIAPGYTIECSDMNLGEYKIPNKSAYGVLLDLQEKYKFYAKIKDNTLKCYWPFDFKTWDTHTYKFGVNVKRNNLRFKRAKDIKIRVKGIANQRNGEKLTHEVGSDDKNAATKTINYGTITQEDLIKKTEADHKRISYDGYTGSITGWAVPLVHAGDKITIKDDLEPVREGDYLVEKTTIRYGISQGFERENTLSYKV